jgi:hypothetical protein
MQLYVDTQAARWDLAVIAPQGGALHAGLSATVWNYALNRKLNWSPMIVEGEVKPEAGS